MRRTSWDVQHPGTIEITEGATRSYPALLAHGQQLNVTTDAYGRYLNIEEAILPSINYARFPYPEFQDEVRAREREWTLLRAAGYAGLDVFGMIAERLHPDPAIQIRTRA